MNKNSLWDIGIINGFQLAENIKSIHYPDIQTIGRSLSHYSNTKSKWTVLEASAQIDDADGKVVEGHGAVGDKDHAGAGFDLPIEEETPDLGLREGVEHRRDLVDDEASRMRGTTQAKQKRCNSPPK